MAGLSGACACRFQTEVSNIKRAIACFIMLYGVNICNYRKGKPDMNNFLNTGSYILILPDNKCWYIYIFHQAWDLSKNMDFVGRLYMLLWVGLEELLELFLNTYSYALAFHNFDILFYKDIQFLVYCKYDRNYMYKEMELDYILDIGYTCNIQMDEDKMYKIVQ